MKHLGTYVLLAVLLTTGPIARPAPADGDPALGGARTYQCILAGISAGLCLGFGNVIGFFGAMIAAERMGCL